MKKTSNIFFVVTACLLTSFFCNVYAMKRGAPDWPNRYKRSEKAQRRKESGLTEYMATIGKTDFTELHEAALCGDIEWMRSIFESMPSDGERQVAANKQTKSGHTPLHFAAGNKILCYALRRHGENKPDKIHQPKYQAMISKVTDEQRLECMICLKHYGATLNPFERTVSPLIIAAESCNPKCVHFLISNLQARLDHKVGPRGHTALAKALEVTHADEDRRSSCIAFLVQAGASIDSEITNLNMKDLHIRRLHAGYERTQQDLAQRALAFACAMHPRLGQASTAGVMPRELFRAILENV